MTEIITFVFSLLISSFLIHKYFSYVDINNEFKYFSKDKFCYSFFVSIFVYVGIFIGIIINKFDVSFIFCLLLGILLLKEIIISIIKINYYDKKFKIILRSDDYNINKGKLKREMVIDAIKNNFTLLASPCIILERLIIGVLKIFI